VGGTSRHRSLISMQRSADRAGEHRIADDEGGLQQRGGEHQRRAVRGCGPRRGVPPGWTAALPAGQRRSRRASGAPGGQFPDPLRPNRSRPRFPASRFPDQPPHAGWPPRCPAGDDAPPAAWCPLAARRGRAGGAGSLNGAGARGQPAVTGRLPAASRVL